MDPAAPAVSQDELTRTFGVLLIGFVFYVILYGLTFFQTYIYFTRFPLDDFGTKAIVAAVWAGDTAATTAISHTIYRFLISNFTVPFSSLLLTRTFVTEQAIVVALIFIVQAFYAYRLWMVADRHIALPLVVFALALGALALQSAFVANLSNQELFAQIITDRGKLLRGVGSALSLVVDIVIFASMMFYMQPSRNPGMAVPEDWYEKIVVFGFNRGIMFNVMQLISLIVFVAAPRGQGWIFMSWLLSKVYVNSLFAMLNFRNTHLGRGVNEEDSMNQHASNRSGSHHPTGPRETARSVQFNVNPDVKSGDPRNIIELDMVPSRVDGYDDDSGKQGAESVDSSGPSSKRREFDEDST